MTNTGVAIPPGAECRAGSRAARFDQTAEILVGAAPLFRWPALVCRTASGMSTINGKSQLASRETFHQPFNIDVLAETEAMGSRARQREGTA